MGVETGISWTDHTFNPWRGCTKVSEACRFCYAETWAKRTGKKIWGPDAPREMAAEAYWRQPLKWNADAAAAKVRRRVFCSSLADVFEDRPELVAPRARLFAIIQDTPALDWLLLTKRPENMLRLARGYWYSTGWPTNVWAGTTTETQEDANRRIPHLLKVPARVRFISAEPLLGPIDLDGLGFHVEGEEKPDGNVLGYMTKASPGIDWVIVGGESGSQARPMTAWWARNLRDHCREAGVAFHFKQWGEWAPHVLALEKHDIVARQLPDGQLARIGKARAGRVLDGVIWNEYPEVATCRK